MTRHQPTGTTALSTLVEKLAHDPWSLDETERRLLLRTHTEAQASWLKILGHLVEPPAPQDSFPAFLLETAPFARLRGAIGSARSARELDTATADELQHFVDRYRDYLVHQTVGQRT